MVGVSSKHWGRNAWVLLHSLVESFDEENVPAMSMFSVVCLLRYVMPCSVCRGHFDHLLNKNEREWVNKILDGSKSEGNVSKQYLANWLFELHNQVNLATKKQTEPFLPSFIGCIVPAEVEINLFSLASIILLEFWMHPEQLKDEEPGKRLGLFFSSLTTVLYKYEELQRIINDVAMVFAQENEGVEFPEKVLRIKMMCKQALHILVNRFLDSPDGNHTVKSAYVNLNALYAKMIPDW